MEAKSKTEPVDQGSAVVDMTCETLAEKNENLSDEQGSSHTEVNQHLNTIHNFEPEIDITVLNEEFHIKDKSTSDSSSSSDDIEQDKNFNANKECNICNVCNAIFSRKYHLTVHARIHTGEKPYKCDACTKAFADGSSLNKHKRVHTGERPYICDICNKDFIYYSHLKEHKLTHAGKKPYICELCSKAFTTKSNVNKHIRVSHKHMKTYKKKKPLK